MAEEGEPPEGQPPLRILYHAMLGRAGAVVRMCEEKGQPYEFISDFPELAKVCGAFGAAESGTFAPPVVQDGDVTVSQSGACTMYIGEKLGLSAGVPNAAVAMQHLCDIGDWVVECGNAFSAIKELAPEEAVQSLRAFAQKRFVQWVAVLEQSIVGPFYYGAEATYVDYFLVSSVDWLQEVWLKGLPRACVGDRLRENHGRRRQHPRVGILRRLRRPAQDRARWLPNACARDCGALVVAGSGRWRGPG